jgi:predicted ArsR family transcriptional regulator
VRVAKTALAHRALSDEARLRLFSLISEADHPLDVPAMAEALGLHPNTIRSHLRRLEAAGLVVSETEIRTARGRPRQLFKPGPAAEEVGQGARDYKLLASMLAGYAKAGSGDPASAAESAGRAWGGYLGAQDRLPPGETADVGSAVELIARMMERLGFEPEVQRSGTVAEVLLHNCPFRDVAERYPEVVCSLHLGILRGALQETAATVDATDLEPFVTPSLCVARLEER